MTSPSSASLKLWTVIHKNCREHYATPRLLAGAGLLNQMITDVWMAPGWKQRVPFAGGLQSRWHPDLAKSSVIAFNGRLLPRKLWERVIPGSWWQRMEAEDIRFQRLAAWALRTQLNQGPRGICFSFAYSALEPFRLAKRAGWKTVLGQVDPGPLEWQIVKEAARQDAGLEPLGEAPSDAYWDRWRQETELADVIIANSEWSASLLRQQGLPEHKLRVIPLLYEPEERCLPAKMYPRRFSKERPLRLLFLGRLCLRKGVAPLLDALRGLPHKPIELRLIGPVAMTLPTWIQEGEWTQKIQVQPPVSGADVKAAYDWADAFILPTLSDGFAITQLEALARKVPVIVSERCARVVRHRKNGWVLEEVTLEAIQNCLRQVLGAPEELTKWSRKAEVPSDSLMPSLQEHYRALTAELSSE